jgi:hypothetical protein
VFRRREIGGVDSIAPPRDGEIAAVSVVTPWYALRVTITPCLRVALFATRRARSFASDPVQVYITFARARGRVPRRSSEYSMRRVFRYRVFVFTSAAWAAIASTTRGCEWPTDGTLL